MQDTFARATHSAARPSARATIGYLIYKRYRCSLDALGLKTECSRRPSAARDDRVSCIQIISALFTQSGCSLELSLPTTKFTCKKTYFPFLLSELDVLKVGKNREVS